MSTRRTELDFVVRFLVRREGVAPGAERGRAAEKLSGPVLSARGGG
jgi:hypothetical protein